MRKAWWAMLAFVLAVAVVANLQAEQADKETTVKGNITCAKCELKKETKCTTVIVVKEKDKDVVYYFDKAGHDKYHDDICTKGKKGSVTGTVEEKEGKKIIMVKKVDYDK
jgi:RecG-like helicase